jgi:hypothetical protein
MDEIFYAGKETVTMENLLEAFDLRPSFRASVERPSTKPETNQKDRTRSLSNQAE